MHAYTREALLNTKNTHADELRYITYTNAEFSGEFFFSSSQVSYDISTIDSVDFSLSVSGKPEFYPRASNIQ